MKLNKIIQVPASAEELFLKAVKQLNRKAKRLNLIPVTVKKIRTVIREKTIHREGTDKVETRPIECIEFGMNRDVHEASDWRFAATVEELEHSRMILSSPDLDVTIPRTFESDDLRGICEHCHTRRNRTNTYIVHNTKTNEFRQVGKSCLKDFCSTFDLNEFGFIAEITLWLRENVGGDMDDGFFGMGGGSYRDWSFKPLDIAAMAFAAVRQWGWVSTAQAREDEIASTSSMVHLNLPPVDPNLDSSDRIIVTEADEAKAEAALAWALQIDPNTDNEFLHKLRQAVSETEVPRRLVGIVGAIVPTFNRHLDIITKRQEQAKEFGEIKEGFFGEIKKREDFRLKTLGTTELYNDFGCMTLIRGINLDTMTRFVWFASNPPEAMCVKGAECLVKGTVKDQSIHSKFGHQTIINRCKLIEVLTEGKGD